MDQRAAALDGGRQPRADELDLDGQLLGHPDGEQVHVERTPVDGVDLDAADEHRPGLAALDLEVDEGGRAGVLAQLLELVGIDGDGLVVGAVAVDDAGQAALLAETGDGLADHGAGLGRERGTVSHRV